MPKKMSSNMDESIFKDLKPKELMNNVKVQPDVQNLLFLLTQGRFMFLVPWSTKKLNRLQIFRILLVLVLIPVSYKLLMLRKHFFSKLPVSCLVTDVSVFLLSVIAIMGFCLSQNYYYDRWEKMMNIVLKTENLLSAGTNYSVKRQKFFWWYFLLHVMYVIPHGLQINRWLRAQLHDLTISYIVFRIIHYWTTFIAVLICYWLAFLTRRYDYLKKFLEDNFSQRTLVVRQIIENLKLVGEIYKNLTSTCDELNIIFSMHLLFVIMLTITLTLHGLSFAIATLNNTNGYIEAIVFVTLFFTNMLAIIIFQELLQKKSRAVIKTCLFLQEDMFHCDLRSELSFLIKSMKKLDPKLSAAGFFEMDSQLISAYIGSVFAYLIIILQFNMTFV